MLTIFTVPKPFDGHIGIIQRNAIQSWRHLRPACQILLCGDEAGTAETAATLGVDRIAAVERNEFGTPLLSSVFAAVEASAAHDLLCYVNADILLLSDFTEAASRIIASKPRFLMVGQRWDLDVTEQL
ncbi:MAG TPA: glycosyl transferase family 2, partial [Candidatus Eisenbacteria bacterium]